MVDDVETFTKVDNTHGRNFAVIHSTQGTVRNVKQSRLGGVSGSKIMLDWREEAIGLEVIVELNLDQLLNYLGDGGKDGDRTEVGGIFRIAGFVDGVNYYGFQTP